MLSPSNLVGKLIDQFRLDQYIAKGAMGMVFKAFDTVLVRTVALKLISKSIDEEMPEEEAAAREEARKRLIQEAIAAGRLTHPNIVTIHCYGETEEYEYICMEYVDGRTLGQLLNEKKTLEVDEAVPIFEQILLALDVANEQQIVHRDIKPSNIMIKEDGRVKVMDFGVAKLPSLSLSMTRTGMVLGTPYYMSPEQISGQKVDIRSDIFSVGAVLYEVFTGEKPFKGQNTATLAYQIVQTEPVPPRIVNVYVSEPVGRIIMKAMAKDPALRYQKPSEMLEDLRALIRGSTVLDRGMDDSATVLIKPTSFDETVLGTRVRREAEATQHVSAVAPSVKETGPQPPLTHVAFEETTAGSGPCVPEEGEKRAPQAEASGFEREAVKLEREAVKKEETGGRRQTAAKASGASAVKPPKLDLTLGPPRKRRLKLPLLLGLVLLLLLGGILVLRQGTSPPQDSSRPSVQPGASRPAGMGTGQSETGVGYPPGIPSLLAEANSLLASNPEKAKALFEEVLGRDSGNFEAAYQLGRLYTSQRNYPTAVQKYQMALAINDKSPDIYFNLGYIYMNLGDYDSALRSYESCRALMPPYQDEVLANLGVIHMKRNNLEAARAFFQQAIDANPANTTAKNYLASLLSSFPPAPPPTVATAPVEPAQPSTVTGGTQGVMQGGGSTTVPPSPTGVSASAEALLLEAKGLMESNPDRAHKLLLQATALDPGNFDAVFHLGRLLTFKKDYPGAIQRYHAALRLNTNAPTVYFNLGYVYMMQKNYDLAIANYESCLALMPPYRDEVLTNLGICYLRKGDRSRARQLLQEALGVNEENKVAQKYLELLEKEGGKRR